MSRLTIAVVSVLAVGVVACASPTAPVTRAVTPGVGAGPEAVGVGAGPEAIGVGAGPEAIGVGAGPEAVGVGAGPEAVSLRARH